jgi:quinol monooxygenase YgiN
VLIDRRQVIAGTFALGVSACAGIAKQTEAKNMYGMIGKMTATPGKRDELIGYLLDSTGGMPGRLSYVVAKDLTDANAIWITEVWDSKESHDASLQLPAVQNAIKRARPIIAGFSDGVTTQVVGGVGLR